MEKPRGVDLANQRRATIDMKKFLIFLAVLATGAFVVGQVPYGSYQSETGDSEVQVAQKQLNVMAHAKAFAITPNDGTDLTHTTNTIYVGGPGALKVDMAGSGTVTYAVVSAGQFLDIQVKRVYATGTTATNLIGEY